MRLIGQYRKFRLVGKMHKDLGIEYISDLVHKVRVNHFNRAKKHPNSFVQILFTTQVRSINIKGLCTWCKVVFCN